MKKLAFEPLRVTQPGNDMTSKVVHIGFVPIESESWDYAQFGAGTLKVRFKLNGDLIVTSLPASAAASLTDADRLSLLSLARETLTDPGYPIQTYAEIRARNRR